MGRVNDTKHLNTTNFTCDERIHIQGFELLDTACYVVLDQRNHSKIHSNKTTKDYLTCSLSCKMMDTKVPNYQQFYKLNHTFLFKTFSEVFSGFRDEGKV